MVKRKAPEPKRLGPENQVSWTMGEASQNTTNVPDLIDDSEQVDDHQVDINQQPKSRKKRKSKYRQPQPDERLTLKLSKCRFHLTVQNQRSTELTVNREFRLGSMEFAADRQLPVDQPQFWIYVGEDPDCNFAYFEWPKGGVDGNRVDGNQQMQVRYHDLVRSPPYELLEAVKSKSCFSLRLENADRRSRTMSVAVCLRGNAVAELQQPRDASKPVFKPEMRVVVKHFFDICAPDFSDFRRARDEDIEGLYAAVKRHHDADDPGGATMLRVQHPDLVPTLRPYQESAVRWMLAKENFGQRPQEDRRVEKKLHGLYTELKLPDGQLLYFNRYGGTMTREMPHEVAATPGGILADEMGLGKTVEVLSLVLNHPRPPPPHESADHVHDHGDSGATSRDLFECVCGGGGKRDRDSVRCDKCGLWQHARCVKYDWMAASAQAYYCPHCWVTVSCPSRATLIVTPSAIVNQWAEEISRHAAEGSLRVLVYAGVHDEGFVQPPTLADNDIVLMSYAVMRRELNYVDLPHSNSDTGRRFRRPKRFMAVPSPLVAVDWWRICLDEAQMVEGTTAKTAEMALRLTAVNRWCVTGTPIEKHIDDLYGLLLFMGTDPYCVKHWWDRLLLDPYVCGERDAMHAVIGSVLWRTAKKDVLDQINIPRQREETHWRSFTPAEEHFYRQQHIECSRDMISRLNRFGDTRIKLNSLNSRTRNQLLAPLLQLRQACVHPQVVRGQFMNMHSSKLTMEELLESLIKKTKVACEEAHRLLVASLNGLAALCIIKQQWLGAVEKYREVLQSVRDAEPQIRTDTLQQLHTLHNLAEVLESGHQGIPPTIRDADLRQEEKDLRKVYLTKYIDAIGACRKTLGAAVEAVRESEANFKCKTPWWSQAIGWAARSGRGPDIVDRIKTELASSSKHNISIAGRFQDTNGLQYVLHRQLEDLEKSRLALSTAVNEMQDEPSAEVIEGAVQCHLRPTEKSPKKCIYCEADALFNNYESVLFSFEKENWAIKKSMPSADGGVLGKLRHGTWANSEVEQVLKIVLIFSRLHAVESSWLEDGQNHSKMFEALKKEFKGLRGVWMQLCDQASAIDELNMATTRLRLRLPHERGLKFNPPRPDILELSEVYHQNIKLSSDRVVARNELQKKLGQLAYLKNLSESDYGKRGGSNPEPCPICQQALEKQWSVLQCGHCFCLDCIRILVAKYCFGGRHRSLKCPVCRHPTSHGEISYVNTSAEGTGDDDAVKVLGSYSTKIEAVVVKLMQIKLTEPKAKTLVFSTWPVVLDILAEALTENHLTFTTLMNSSKFQDNLSKFKREEDVGILLLPVHSGANGLNLIEATHVLLVEPILNPASELQAIGRVHRIGQSKPTVIHRFLIRGTIEERMDSKLLRLPLDGDVAASSHGTEENPLTVRNLLDLFV